MQVSIRYTMDDNSPCNHLVVAINMPKVIWLQDMITCVTVFLLLSNLFLQPLSWAINMCRRDYHMVALYM